MVEDNSWIYFGKIGFSIICKKINHIRKSTEIYMIWHRAFVRTSAEKELECLFPLFSLFLTCVWE